MTFFDFFFTFGSAYNRALTSQPILVKCITASIIGSLGNIVAQKIKNVKGRGLWLWGIFAVALYTFFVGAPLTQLSIHILYHYGPANVLLQVLIDNFIFGPVQLVFGLYLIPRIEGSNHSDAWAQLKILIWDAFVMANQVWIPAQIVNFNYVPLQYRVLFANFVAFGWTIYLSMKQLSAKTAEKTEKSKEE